MAAPKTHKAPKTKYATVLYHRVVQLEVPRDPSLPPLSPEEQAAHDRNVQALRNAPIELLQLDATAYPGNSGGPVIEVSTGLVVGVVMSFGWLPKVDIGYEWFNANILDLF